MKNGKNLKVMQIIKGLDIGGIHGGADQFGLNLAVELKRIWPNTILCIYFKMNSPAEEAILNRLNENNIETIFLGNWSGKTSVRGYFRCFIKLQSIVRKRSINLIHSHFHIGTLAALTLKLFGVVKYVVRTAHADKEWLRGWEGIIQQIIIKVLIFIIFPVLVDLEVGVSRASVNTLNERFVAKILKKRSFRIFNSIPIHSNPSISEYNDQYKFPKQDRKFVIGSVGRLSEQKGYFYLLKAMKQVVQDIPSAVLWVIGEGEQRGILEDYSTQSGITNNIIFWGKRDDVPKLLDQIDVFVLASIYEGLPTVVLESMASNVPVIATEIPGTDEIIEDGYNGWLVLPENPQDLAKKIVQVLNNPSGIPHIVTNAQRTLRKFSIQCAAQEYIAAYERLIR